MVNFKNLRRMIELKGNGKVVTKEFPVSTYIRLHLSCKGTIELHQSDEEKVSIEADENLLEYFAATNAGRTLYVSTEANVRKLAFTHCVIKVYFRQLNMLYVRNDGGNVICPNELLLKQPLEVKVQSVGDTELNLDVPSLKILCQTQGNTTLKGKCDKLHIRNQSQGDFNAAELKAGELNIKNMAQGNVCVHVDGSICISHYGHGHIHYSGDADVRDVKHYGDGEIKHVSAKESA